MQKFGTSYRIGKGASIFVVKEGFPKILHKSMASTLIAAQGEGILSKFIRHMREKESGRVCS